VEQLKVKALSSSPSTTKKKKKKNAIKGRSSYESGRASKDVLPKLQTGVAALRKQEQALAVMGDVVGKCIWCTGQATHFPVPRTLPTSTPTEEKLFAKYSTAAPELGWHLGDYYPE
jgi:hypothetical protein